MVQLNKVNFDKLGFFRFKKLGKNYLLTNEIGEYIFLKPELFKKFLAGKINPKLPIYQKLKEKNFIGDQINKKILAEKYRQKNQFLFQGPSLHIVVVTLRCDHKCIYCQASSRSINEKGFDMDIQTAKKVVDVIFQSPSQYITIELQGGEPLLNWQVVKFITEYAQEKNRLERKFLQITLVSNFSSMDNTKSKYLLEKEIGLCTSLDGPEFIHNKNRIFLTGNSYKNVIKWIKRTRSAYRKRKGQNLPAALTTITRYSLPYWKEIVDEYKRIGFERIYLRYLQPFGLAKKTWREIGYSSKEFVNFYRKAVDYLIRLNLKGLRLREYLAEIILSKILELKDPAFLDLRSPCGAGIGQMLYNYDGKVYTCDEARTLGEEIFKIGDVYKNTYQEMVDHENVKSLLIASCLDNLSCDYCVYKPYCGVCPVRSYSKTGNIFTCAPTDERCKILQGIFEYLFKKLQDKNSQKVLMEWTKKLSLI